MDLYGATRIGDKDTTTFGFVGDWVIQHDTVRKNLGYTRTLAERMNLAAMTPRGDLASSGYCLANPGKEYLVYQPVPGAAFTVDLHAGTYEYEWFDPGSGTTNAGDSFVAADGAHTFTAPFREEVVLHIRRRGI